MDEVYKWDMPLRLPSSSTNLPIVLPDTPLGIHSEPARSGKGSTCCFCHTAQEAFMA